jgi:hypothetical protein
LDELETARILFEKALSFGNYAPAREALEKLEQK